MTDSFSTQYIVRSGSTLSLTHVPRGKRTWNSAGDFGGGTAMTVGSVLRSL